MHLRFFFDVLFDRKAMADVDALLSGIGQAFKPYPTEGCVSGDGNVTYI